MERYVIFFEENMLKWAPVVLAMALLMGVITEFIVKRTLKKGQFQSAKNNKTAGLHIISVILSALVAVFSLVVTTALICGVLISRGVPTKSSAEAADEVIMDRYDMYMTNEVSNALDGVMSIEKVYWLNDNDLIAPKPDASRFGTTTDPSSLQWLLDEASALLGETDFLFSTDVKIAPGTQIMYYLDETIFAISWLEMKDTCYYTYGEVKIAHPSQFRRFLAGGTYGSDKQFTTTQMANDVNAVLASSGDFYKFRNLGIIVYDGEVKRVNSREVDTCFIDDKGDLIFSYRGQLGTVKEAQKFVDENNIRFSIAFGPALIDNGQLCKLPSSYPCGEIYETYARAGLCQMGPLHYLIVTTNREENNYSQKMPTIPQFARRLQETGCIKAYTLDGGQTGVIAMNGIMRNPKQYGSQRKISDIFYFATALPDGE